MLGAEAGAGAGAAACAGDAAALWLWPFLGCAGARHDPEGSAHASGLPTRGRTGAEHSTRPRGHGTARPGVAQLSRAGAGVLSVLLPAWGCLLQLVLVASPLPLGLPQLLALLTRLGWRRLRQPCLFKRAPEHGGAPATACRAAARSFPSDFSLSQLFCQAAETAGGEKEAETTNTKWWRDQQQKHPTRNGKVGAGTPRASGGWWGWCRQGSQPAEQR